jgi:hypothetical protein
MMAGAAASSLGVVHLLSSLGFRDAQDLIAFAVAPSPPSEERPLRYPPQIRQWVAPPNFYGS